VFGSECTGTCGQCVGPFPSLTHNPTLQFATPIHSHRVRVALRVTARVDFHSAGSAAPRRHSPSNSCYSVAEKDLVVVLVNALDATTPGRNSSAQPTAVSSSSAITKEEPFTIAANPW